MPGPGRDLDVEAGRTPPRIGVCVVRAEEHEGAVRVRITVTSRLDVHDPETEEIWQSVSIPEAVERVWAFLGTFEAAAR
jgi:hypothetical protein